MSQVICAFLIGLILALLIIGGFIAMIKDGPTLGNRCERAFPGMSYIDKERCANHLYNNGRIWEFKPSEVK